MNLFIVPGNPPAVHFYKLWRSEILAAHPEYNIEVSSYSRHKLRIDSYQYLERVAEGHSAALERFRAEVGGPVTIVGHSLGGWMTLKLLEKSFEFVDNAFLLYPFLREPTRSGHRLLDLFHHLHQLPFLEKVFLKGRPYFKALYSDFQHLSDEEIRSALNLVYHERNSIAKQKVTPTIAPYLAKKLHLIYCDDDRWCSKDLVNDLTKIMTYTKTKATHGFVVSKKERATVFKAILKATAIKSAPNQNETKILRAFSLNETFNSANGNLPAGAK